MITYSDNKMNNWLIWQIYGSLKLKRTTKQQQQQQKDGIERQQVVATLLVV